MMRTRLLWFLLGAGVSAVVTGVLLPSWRPELRTLAAAGSPAATLDERLASIDRRLAALESRGLPSARGATGSTAATDSSPPASAIPERTPAQQRAATAATSIVMQAIAAGAWTRGNAQEFAAAAGGLPGAERAELMRQLAVAINEDRVRIEPGAPLY